MKQKHQISVDRLTESQSKVRGALLRARNHIIRQLQALVAFRNFFQNSHAVLAHERDNRCVYAHYIIT